MATFDQKGQKVNNQYIAGRDMHFDNQSDDFANTWHKSGESIDECASNIINTSGSSAQVR